MASSLVAMGCFSTSKAVPRNCYKQTCGKTHPIVSSYKQQSRENFEEQNKGVAMDRTLATRSK
jgi:hypothetical protein